MLPHQSLSTLKEDEFAMGFCAAVHDEWKTFVPWLGKSTKQGTDPKPALQDSLIMDVIRGVHGRGNGPRSV